MSILIHLIYASTATVELDRAALGDILRISRRNNERDDVTGMLLHMQGSFFQVLEGEPGRIDTAFQRIAGDHRHRNVVTIIRERIASRAFGDWSMGFAEVAASDVATISGANDFFGDATCFDALDAGRAKKLLTAFRNKRWHAA